MTTPPGMSPVGPQAEAGRLARECPDPPGREWAIRHPGGNTTHMMPSREAAGSLRSGADLDCGECAGGTRALVCRDPAPWREAT